MILILAHLVQSFEALEKHNPYSRHGLGVISSFENVFFTKLKLNIVIFEAQKSYLTPSKPMILARVKSTCDTMLSQKDIVPQSYFLCNLKE